MAQNFNVKLIINDIENLSQIYQESYMFDLVGKYTKSMMK